MATQQQSEARRTARELLRFLEEMMNAIVRVDLGDPAVAQLSLLELRVLMVLGDSAQAATLSELAQRSGTSIGQSGQATAKLRSRGLAERSGGGGGPERAFSTSSRGRRLLHSLEAGHQIALEGLISALAPKQRLRLEGAAHLLGSDLDRLSSGLLAA